MSQNPEVSNILKELQALSQENTINIYLPSLKTKIAFKKLNLKQQKSLVLVAMDNALSLLNFNVALYDIISENLVEQIDLNTLNLFDKNSIILSLIAENATAKSEPNKKALTSILSKYETANIDINSKTIKFNGGEVEIKIPSLATEYRFNKTLLTKYTKTVENQKEFVSDVYVIELCKYINSITMKSGVVKLVEYSLSNIIEIAESLPVITPVTQYITQIKDIETKLNTHNNETIDISPSLFI
jgi:hypothetical protein